MITLTLEELAKEFLMSVFGVGSRELHILQNRIKKVLITPIPLLFTYGLEIFGRSNHTKLQLRTVNLDGFSFTTFYNTMFSISEDLLLLCPCPGASAVMDLLYIILGSLPVKIVLFVGAYGAVREGINPGDFIYVRKAMYLDPLEIKNVIECSPPNEVKVKLETNGFKPVNACSTNSIFMGYYSADRIPEVCDVIDLETYHFCSLLNKIVQQLKANIVFASLGLVTDNIKTLKLMDSNINVVSRLNNRSKKLIELLASLVR